MSTVTHSHSAPSTAVVPATTASRAEGHCGAVHAGNLLRDVRRRRGLSIRAAAERCDVPRATWGDWEAARSAPPVRRLDEVLAALRFDLRVVEREAEPPGEQAVRRHLRRSLTERGRTALGDQLAAAVAACRQTPRLLTGPAAVGVWVPHAVARGPLPLPPAPTSPGWVPVRLEAAGAGGPAADAVVAPPAVLLSEGQAEQWPQLLTSVRLLATEAPRDLFSRRLPAHRDPDEDREHRDLAFALEWAGRGAIPISRTDSRAWRLDAPATLDAALLRAGLPLRNRSRR